MAITNGNTNGSTNGSHTSSATSVGFDVRGITPAPVTPFTKTGEVDYEAIHRLSSWLSSIEGVKGLVVLGHAGEGTFLTSEEQCNVIRAFKKSSNGVPIIAGITGEGNYVAGLEAKRAKEAGAAAGLLYPSHGQSCMHKERLKSAEFHSCRMAAIRLPEGRTSTALQGCVRALRPTLDSLPVPRQHESVLRPANSAGYFRSARCFCHEERCSQHAPVSSTVWHEDQRAGLGTDCRLADGTLRSPSSASNDQTCRSCHATTSTCSTPHST